MSWAGVDPGDLPEREPELSSEAGCEGWQDAPREDYEYDDDGNVVGWYREAAPDCDHMDGEAA